MEKQIFAVGDIHGCFDKLKALLDKIPFDPQRDTIVFLGDYVDRGPSSYEVVEFLIELKKNCENAVFLKGNHEEMLEACLFVRIDRAHDSGNAGDREADLVPFG